MSDDLTVVTRYKEAGYTFNLYSDGSFVVTHPKAGVMDEGQATMGEVHAEDASTYMDAWLEELRCLMAECDREFGAGTDSRGRP